MIEIVLCRGVDAHLIGAVLCELDVIQVVHVAQVPLGMGTDELGVAYRWADVLSNLGLRLFVVSERILGVESVDQGRARLIHRLICVFLGLLDPILSVLAHAQTLQALLRIHGLIAVRILCFWQRRGSTSHRVRMRRLLKPVCKLELSIQRLLLVVAILFTSHIPARLLHTLIDLLSALISTSSPIDFRVAIALLCGCLVDLIRSMEV